MKLAIGTKVYPKADDKKESAKLKNTLKVGWIRAIVAPAGTAGEESYAIWWLGLRSEGSGWRDCDVSKA